MNAEDCFKWNCFDILFYKGNIWWEQLYILKKKNKLFRFCQMLEGLKIQNIIWFEKKEA
jgi:hypothetical protein